jgi:hypothetical protein
MNLVIDAATPIDAPAPAALSPGTWTYVSYTRTADTCGNQVEGDDQFAIDMATATSFRIVWPGSAHVTSSCVVNVSNYFACTTQPVTLDQAPVYDAIVTLNAEMSGHITTTTLATGKQRIIIGCTGTQCADVHAIPCSVSADVVVKKVGS